MTFTLKLNFFQHFFQAFVSGTATNEAFASQNAVYFTYSGYTLLLP